MVAEWRLHKFQSPIELSHDESISHDHFDPLEFHGHWDKAGEATFENTGKTGEQKKFHDIVQTLLHHPQLLFLLAFCNRFGTRSSWKGAKTNRGRLTSTDKFAEKIKKTVALSVLNVARNIEFFVYCLN